MAKQRINIRMNKSAVIYIVIGLTITTASFAFFNEWMGMPMQMGQKIMMPSAQPCACQCLTGASNGI
jgi:hypothetical protein